MPASDKAVVRYHIDTVASQFTVQAFASGLISAVAHSPKIAIRDWKGVIKMPSAGTPNNASLEVRIKADSLQVLDELRDSDHREIHRVMNQEVLNTATFPEILFDSTEVTGEKMKDDLFRVKIRGRLVMHGVTNNHVFVSQVAMGVDSARAYGEFAVKQSDYDIPIASIAGGTLKLMDELKVSFYVVARKSEDEELSQHTAAF